MTLDNSVHAFSDAERSAFVRHINSKLAGNPHVSHLLPLNPDNNDIFGAVKDGILLRYFIFHIKAPFRHLMSHLVSSLMPQFLKQSMSLRLPVNFNQFQNHFKCLKTTA